MEPSDFKRIRNKLGLSQPELADLLGLFDSLPKRKGDKLVDQVRAQVEGAR